MLPAKGHRAAATSAAHEVDGRDAVERALAEREAQYRAVIETQPDGFCVIDTDGRILDVNESYVRRSGYSRAELLSMSVDDLEAAETPEQTAARRVSIIAGGNALFETVHRAKDGTLWQVEVNTSYWPIGGGRFFTFLCDVTRRKRSEALLRTRLQLSELAMKDDVQSLLQHALDASELFTGSSIGFFHFVDDDEQHLLLQTWSTNTLARMCTAQGAGTHYPVHEAGVWADALRLRRALIHNDYASLPGKRGMPEGHAPVVREVVVPVEREGRIVAVLGVGNKRSDYDEDDVSIVREIGSMVMEVVARKRAEAALRESEERYRTVADHTFDWEYWRTSDGKLEYCSPSCERVCGYTAAELTADPSLLGRMVHPDDLAAWLEHAELAGRRDRPLSIDYRVRTRAGELRWIAHVCSPVFRAGGDFLGWRASNRDITERKLADQERRELEARLRQAQRLESVGRLAGGIAHDFNNLLTVINTYSAMALDSVPAREPLHDDLEEIHRAGERAAGLTRQLLAFSRRQVLQPRVVALNEVVGGMEGMLRRLIGEDVSLEVLPSAAAGRVRVDVGQLEQVVMNLVVNARDAMPDGGTLTLATAALDVDADAAARVPGLVPGRYEVLEVRDTGCGMTDDVRARIFEPFFTTKEPGRGTGLGLATVYGIVTQSGGAVGVESAPGRGSVFSVYLPTEGAIGDSPTSKAVQPRWRGGETVLVAEDDESVRTLARRILSAAGYRVLTAESGTEALLLLEQLREPLQLVLTDVVMPGMGGRELAARVAERSPATRILYTSGYTDDAFGMRDALEPGLWFLAKPFTPESLTRKVREVLDGEG